MLSHIRKSKEKGFTIIEVLIVLAIAGLILLVVFLAVPALQRNSRNTQRGSDIASILGVVNEYTNNNNGALPDTLAVASDGTLTVSDSTSSSENQITTKLGYYKSGVSWGGTTVPASNTTTTSTVIVYSQAECNATATQAVGGATVPSRSIAATYTLEATAKQCKAS